MSFFQKLRAGWDLINRVLPAILDALSLGGTTTIEPVRLTNWFGYDAEIRGAADGSGKLDVSARPHS